VKSPLALPDKPSLTVLPLQNLRGNAEQEYFVNRVVDEIIASRKPTQSLDVAAHPPEVVAIWVEGPRKAGLPEA
jgi:TolB-like protein